MDNRNLILAIVLSVVVLIGWQYFIAAPEIEKVQQQQAIDAQQVPEQPGAAAPTDGAAVPSTPATSVAVLTRDQAIALSKAQRIEIATPRLSGSINLAGGRIDDLRLIDFRETVDPTSPTIVLLSPGNTAEGYFAEFGWVPEAGVTAPGAETVWAAPAGAKLTTATPVTLAYDNGAGLAFTRTIAIDDNYMFTVTDRVTNSGAVPVSLSPYGRVVRIGEPVTTGFFILHEGLIGVFNEEGLEEVDYSDLQDVSEKPMAKSDKGWIGITDKYWATALVPAAGKTFTGHFARYETPSPRYQADFRQDAVTVQAGGAAEAQNRVFAGAKQVAVVDGYEQSLGIDKFELLVDWGWFHFITKPMFYLIDWFFKLVGNFGVAILAVTVLVKAVFFPLANKSYKSMSAMKKVQPQMLEIRERFKDDKVKQQQAMMELYKKEKINPLAGCWPILLQIPVFFALYKVLFVTIEMRHAPFFGWIQDLSAPDPTHLFNLFGLIPWDPPSFLAIGVWPLIMGATMFVQMRLNPTPPDPTQRFIFTWMPLLFTFMLASFPAGLVIYWAWNNTLSVAQQYTIMRRQGADVDLWGNIANTFKRKSKDGTVKKPAAAPALVASAANDDDEPKPVRAKSKRSPKTKPSSADAKG